MIEFQEDFKRYLSEERQLKDGSIYNYLTYLRVAPKHLDFIVSPQTVTSATVESIVKQLKEIKIDWSNTQSALRAYADYVQKYHFNALYPDELTTFTEGTSIRVSVNIYERSRKAREVCIQFHGAICNVCGIDFESTYGVIGKGFIHVHHITPLSSISDTYELDPIQDLIPVCPNCHAMLHKKDPPFLVSELRAAMRHNG